MQVILTIEAGPLAGQKIWLRSGQKIQVGRTEQAGFVVPFDSTMSGLHFGVECEANECRVRDLDSSNGTLLNQERINEATLDNGDVILAGDTKFRVSTVGQGKPTPVEADPPKPLAGNNASVVVADRDDVNAPDTAPPPQVELDPDANRIIKKSVASDAPKQISSKKVFARYSQEDCHSGLAVFRSVDGEPSVAQCFERLSRDHLTFLLLDPRKLDEAQVAYESSDAEYLFDWLPSKVAAAVSPVVYQASASDDDVSLLQQAWGLDALICFYTQLDKVQLLKHLRAKARYQAAETDQVPDPADQAVLAYYWPSTMAMLLANSTAEFIADFLLGIDAVLLECGSSESWQLFAHHDFAQTLNQIGDRGYRQGERRR